MKSNAIQFWGEDQVVGAYEMNEMAPWSMWNGQAMMFVYDGDDINEGAQILAQTMEMLRKGGSSACFTLKVYEDLPPGGKIKSKTDYSRSFNFSVFDSANATTGYQQKQNTVIGALESRFNELQTSMLERIYEKMDAEDEEEKHPPKEGGVIGMVSGLLDNPQFQEMAISKLSQLIGNWMGSSSPGAIAGIEQPQREQGENLLTEEQAGKVDQAIDILCRYDPLLGDNLLKVAQIARENQGKYKMLTGML